MGISANLPSIMALACVVTLVPLSVNGQFRINEVMANNDRAFLNPDTDSYPDYIEVMNVSEELLDLQGYRLTDQWPNDTNVYLKEFVFPSVTVPPGGYIVVYTDDLASAPGFHANFRMHSTGEILSLLDNVGETVDSVTFGFQPTDLSIGRVPDGNGNWTLNVATPNQPNQSTPLGGPEFLRINEWMPLWGKDWSTLPETDWIELYNGTNLPVSIGDMFLTDYLGSGLPDSDHQIAPLSFIEPLGYVLLFAKGGTTLGLDELGFRLASSSGETNRLLSSDGLTLIDQIAFGPQGTNIANMSTGRLPDGSTNIVQFPVLSETPGKQNFLHIPNVIINEILSHSELPLEDAIELYNPSSAPVSISQYWMSNDRSIPQMCQLPVNTVIPPGGFKVFYEADLCFSLNSFLGGEVNLYGVDETGAWNGYRLRKSFGPSANGVSFGHYLKTDGESDFVALTERSFGMDNPTSVEEFRTGTGRANSPLSVGPVVISEILYHPVRDLVGTNLVENARLEFVELLNITSSPVDLFDPDFPTNSWKLDDAITFEFPKSPSRGFTLPAGGRVLIVKFNPALDTSDLTLFRQRYPSLVRYTQLLGPYSGKLGNGGDNVELLRPDKPLSDTADPENFGFVPYIRVDRVNYDDSLPWPNPPENSPDGGGASLERIIPEEYGNDPGNWRAASPTPGGESLQIISFQRSDGAPFTLRFRGQAGSSYSVLYQDQLANPPIWMKLPGADFRPTTTGIIEVTNDVGVASRFFKVVSPAWP